MVSLVVSHQYSLKLHIILISICVLTLLLTPHIVLADTVVVGGCQITGSRTTLRSNDILVGDTPISITLRIVLVNASPSPESYFIQFFDYVTFAPTVGQYNLTVPSSPNTLPLTLTVTTRPIYSYTQGKLVNDTFYDTLSPNIGFSSLTTTINNCPVSLPVVAFKQGISPYNDNNPPWEGNRYDSFGTIAEYGCAMTSTAMLLNWMGATTDPGQLNTWLRSQTDGYKGSSLNWIAAARYARDRGIQLYYHGAQARSSSADNTLNTSISQARIPVVLDVSGLGGTSSHFVLATGQTQVNGNATWRINDPSFNRDTLQQYGNTYKSLRNFSVNPVGALLVGGSSSIAILVTDPSGRQTGYNFNSGQTVSEIPNSNYYRESIENDADSNGQPTPEEKLLEIIEPADGVYTIQIIGLTTDLYTFHFFGYDQNQDPTGSTIVTDQAVPGSVHTYQLTYSSASGSSLPVQRISVGQTNMPAEPTISGLCPLISGGINPVVTVSYPENVMTNGNVFCRVINENGVYVTSAAEIGNAALISRGVLQAIDVFGLTTNGSPFVSFNTPVRICLQGDGVLVFLDATQQPRSVEQLVSTPSSGYTCAAIPNSGTVVLLSSGLTDSTLFVPVDSTSNIPDLLSPNSCSVTTMYRVNLREDANLNAPVIAQLPFNATYTATARSRDWIRVVYNDTQGWINTNYVQTQGVCGE